MAFATFPLNDVALLAAPDELDGLTALALNMRVLGSKPESMKGGDLLWDRRSY